MTRLEEKQTTFHFASNHLLASQQGHDVSELQRENRKRHSMYSDNIMWNGQDLLLF